MQVNQQTLIRETYQGFSAITIQDDMLACREIECIGDIDEDLVNSIIRQLRYLEREDPEAEITIFINSPGGCVSDGLALYDVMNLIKCPIRTVCVGLAASMAAILFTAGDKREMLEHSRIMIHDPLIGGRGISGSATYMDARVKDLMNTRMITASILSDHTRRSVNEILEKTARDSYFYAKEAIEFGLADAVIKEI